MSAPTHTEPVPDQPDAPQSPTGRPVVARRLPLWPVLLGCAAYRLWYLTTTQAALDGDEAMTGLMVRRILAGHRYVFLAGQHYNGAGEQYLQAAVWAVLPQNPLTLRLPQVGLAVLACWLVHRVGRELLGPGRAWLAAALFAVGPFFSVWKGVRSHGGYPTGQVLGLLAIWLAVRLRAGGPRPRLLAAGFGLVAGTAAWTGWSAAYLLLPAAGWLAPQLRRRPGLAGPLAAGALAGYLPALAWAAVHYQLPLLGGTQPDRSPAQRLGLLLGPVLREFLGVGYFSGAPGWPAPLQTAAVLGLAAAYLLACWRRRYGLLDLVLLADRRRVPADLLLLVPPVVAVLYAASKYTWWAGEPRYLLTAYPALALGLAALPPGRAGLARLARLARLGRVAGPGATAGTAAALLLAVGGTSVTTAVRHAGDGDPGRDRCLRQAADWLADHRITAAYSDYWTGMPMQLLAGDRDGLSIGPMNAGRTKFPELRRAADAAPPVYVLSRIPNPMADDDQVAAMDRALAGHRVAAVRTRVGCATVYTDLRPALRPWQLGLGTTLPPG